MQYFILYHFQDIKVVRVPKVAKFQTSSFSGYQGCEGFKVSNFIIFGMSSLRAFQRLQSFPLSHFPDIKVARIAKVENFILYHFQDSKAARVPKVARFQILSFSGYPGCESCKVSNFIIFGMSSLRAFQRLQSFRLYHFQDMKV